MIFLIRKRRARKNRVSGFTLLELIFVAAILIIVSTLAIPRFGKTFDFLQLQNFASDTVSFARYAQAKAITDGKIYRLAFNLGKKTLSIEGRIEPEEGGGGKVESWYVEKIKPIPGYVSVELQGGKGDIRFYPDGTADKATIEISGPSGNSYNISVNSTTGYVKFEEAKEE